MSQKAGLEAFWKIWNTPTRVCDHNATKTRFNFGIKLTWWYRQGYNPSTWEEEVEGQEFEASLGIE